MDCVVVDENGNTGKKREIGSCSDVHSQQHRRSKSYTDNNLDVAQLGVSHAKGKSPKVSQDLRPPERIQRAPSPIIHQDACDTKSVTNHRASLEKDIELLQSRLQQEKSMRIVLERAMGRISSTLSPGHRHVAAQTKELIAEIELLEEEVANREHHVLSLYRSIFDHCVSAAPSQQSSGMTSPAHTKNVRKHPSIISSAFCSSSKKFTLQPFQVLASIKDSKKKNVPLQSKTTRHASLLGGQTNIHIDSKGSDPIKVHGKVPTMEKTSLARTLKDYLDQCPSKLSEELIKCMGAIYCWLQTAVSTTPERNRSPLLSRSSTNVILPRRSAGEDREWSCKSTVEISWISTDKNQFSRASYAINNYRVLVEQLEKVDASQMGNDAQVAFWINVYNSLIMHAYLAYGIPHGSLRRMALFHKAAYNIGGHVISANTIEHTVFGIHTPRTGRWFEAIISTALRKKAGEDKPLLGSAFSLQSSQPLIFFAICSGVSSDPVYHARLCKFCSIQKCSDSDLSLAESLATPKNVPTLKVYTAANIKEELQVAKKEFLQANVLVKKSKKVFLPKVLERFAKESSMGYDDLIKWVSENVDKKLQDSIRKCIDHNAKRKTSQIIDWLPYNMRFRYILTKDLTEKPWWV